MSQTTACILVAVDFSSSSARTIEEARRQARQLGAPLDFVHICSLAPSPPDMPNLTEDGSRFEEARKALVALEVSARADGFTATSHFAVGSAPFGLLDFIQRLQPSLVVAGSHGHSALHRLLLGSVAESLVRRLPVPVLIVPAPERIAARLDMAWSCRDCGHILAQQAPSGRCSQCGVEPPHWISAPISAEPVDAQLPSVADGARDEVSGNSSAGLFATAPGGIEGTDVNPELRVRY